MGHSQHNKVIPVAHFHTQFTNNFVVTINVVRVIVLVGFIAHTKNKRRLNIIPKTN